MAGGSSTTGPRPDCTSGPASTQICAYYDDVLATRMLAPGRVELFTGCDYVGGRAFVSTVTGERFEVPAHCRVVDARYLAPEIPAETSPGFAVGEGVRVVSVNDLVRVEDSPSQYVVVGSGKTATDAVVWLLGQGTDPDRICWVRPRDPWMLNRALIQPDPAVYLAMVADLLRAAADSPSLPQLFERLEEAGIMLRIDRAVEPTMAKAPTLGTWELDLLRSVENVVRRGRLVSVGRGRLDLADGSVAVAEDALVVHCAADGLRNRPLLPIWGAEAITIQPVRAGFPCFGAALVGYVEATRDDDAEKNRLCPPSPLGNSLTDWARMNVIGMRNADSFGAAPDIKAWSNRVALNPARIPPDHPPSDALSAAVEGLRRHAGPGLDQLVRLADAASG